MTGWRLITGITGLLGQYLLCEALGRRESVAVLVRGRRRASAADRVDQLLSSWEKRLGKVLQRPIVLQGDLRMEGLGLSEDDRKWARQNVNSVIHCAASVRFQESPLGEPMSSNLEGTNRLLQFCDNSAVGEFHYVSTAYACGQVNQSTPVLETLHPSRGPFRNIYEKSKCLAEHRVIESPGKFTRTIYRPSVIIGESATGYSPSFNAIYTPLRLAWMLLRDSPSHVYSRDELLAQLDIRGDESRNIVPVDWVCQAISSIVRDPALHGEIYHLTNPVTTDGNEIQSAMIDALSDQSMFVSESNRISNANRRTTLADFRQQMEGYRSYFESDPNFDNSHFRESSACPSCPVAGKEMLSRTFSFAIRSQFRTEECRDSLSCEPEPRVGLDELVNERSPSNCLSKFNGARVEDESDCCVSKLASVSETEKCDSVDQFALRLCLSGSGGGCWQVAHGSTGIVVRRPDAGDANGIQVYGTASVFRSLIKGEISFEESVRSGLFVITGTSGRMDFVCSLIIELVSDIRPTTDQTVEFFETGSNAETSIEDLACGGIPC